LNAFHRRYKHTKCVSLYDKYKSNYRCPAVTQCYVRKPASATVRIRTVVCARRKFLLKVATRSVYCNWLDGLPACVWCFTGSRHRMVCAKIIRSSKRPSSEACMPLGNLGNFALGMLCVLCAALLLCICNVHIGYDCRRSTTM
jgi:hypothetical protein